MPRSITHAVKGRQRSKKPMWRPRTLKRLRKSVAKEHLLFGARSAKGTDVKEAGGHVGVPMRRTELSRGVELVKDLSPNRAPKKCVVECVVHYFTCVVVHLSRGTTPNGTIGCRFRSVSFGFAVGDANDSVPLPWQVGISSSSQFHDSSSSNPKNPKL